MKISVVIAAKDEAERLPEALRSVGFADEVVVVDDESTDGTARIARAAGAVVVRRRLDGFASQKNAGVDAARNDWIFVLDADERVTDGLRRAIEAVGDEPDQSAYAVSRRNHLGDVWLRHGGLYPDHQLRLFDRRRARYGAREIHEVLVVDGSVGTLDGDLLHFTYADLREYRAKVRRYAALEAATLERRPTRRSVLHGVWRRLVTEEGWRDGRLGFASAGLLAYYDVLLRRGTTP